VHFAKNLALLAVAAKNKGEIRKMITYSVFYGGKRARALLPQKCGAHARVRKNNQFFIYMCVCGFRRVSFAFFYLLRYLSITPGWRFSIYFTRESKIMPISILFILTEEEYIAKIPAADKHKNHAVCSEKNIQICIKKNSSRSINT
jgi:hypothetical protein